MRIKPHVKLLTFRKNVVKVGLWKDGKILDLPEAYKAVFGAYEAPDFLYSMRKLIAVGEPALEIIRKIEAEARGPFYAPHEVVWEPPVQDPEKVLAVAVNYRSHGKEMGHEPPPRPYFFPKLPNALVGHERPIIKHRVVQKLDWEVELVVVIGRAGKYIDPERALDYVFGYTVGNDVSIRDWQYPATQYGFNWIWGKSMDTAAPVGPWIVTKDEVPDPNKLGLRLWVNGQLEQEGNTSDLIFNVQLLIHWASQGITLKPGDMIFTGTPPGVGYPKGKFLKGGDIVEAEVETVGLLRNYVIEE
ncbi:5-oxopent-3-ene-1,2,5-tricarboxylate decarboxylase [Pyrobaculum arsenaticum DSM 13514]|uniref:5-oxopent-3-ene-1,2,5-tricarboxylate decarboxylase n=1 Tax=Pyrobaculum arsenaticum (strain DSM 13514 / JCM 11321 / PZ6) TaxID=340102 RepID=A4WKN3_PYRAR|nr:fumarylacetoacetate hydrolase family protein [Pyrobaculum arsenaticum]ABP50950.1 5-oxopent-3-ene-1,2,5-tricarboxylate decarboxylase [Pyrobaculum arsenaticum DSM 13514]